MQKYFPYYLNILIIISLHTHQRVRAQSKNYARNVLKSLCAPEMHGRGYYQKGDSLAAAYIQKELEKWDIQPFGNSYFQRFSLPVNCFNGFLQLKINNKFLRPGADYLISPSSPSFKGKVKLHRISAEELLSVEKLNKKLLEIKNGFVLIDPSQWLDKAQEAQKKIEQTILQLKYHLDVPVQGVVILKEMLPPHAVSSYQSPRASIILKKQALPQKARKIDLHIESQYKPRYQSQNVIGFVPGEIQDTFICITAHYDHLGRMGHHTYFPGANDNASGVAMVLDLARHYAQLIEKPTYSMVFILFGAEEIGLLGSKYYTKKPLFPLSKIKFLLNLDLVGTGDDGIQVVNGKIYTQQFNELLELNQARQLLKQIKTRGEVCNSDHCFFHQNGVPSFFIYTLGGIAHYHNIYDRAETLALTAYEELFQLITSFLKKK